MDEGFAPCELVRDEAGRSVDHRFVNLNRAFESLSGISRDGTIGWLGSEVLPASDASWIGIYGRVVATGEPIWLEQYSKALDRWYDVRAFLRGGDRSAVLSSTTM